MKWPTSSMGRKSHGGPVVRRVSASTMRAVKKNPRAAEAMGDEVREVIINYRDALARLADS